MLHPEDTMTIGTLYWRTQFKQADRPKPKDT